MTYNEIKEIRTNLCKLTSELKSFIKEDYSKIDILWEIKNDFAIVTIHGEDFSYKIEEPKYLMIERRILNFFNLERKLETLELTIKG